jgi:S-formylglutathione hydrolase FrmB
LVAVFPQGDSGWATNALHGGPRLEDDIVNDLVSWIRRSLPVREPGAGWGIAGLSMGGYGAVKLALKRPDLFALAASHSGSFERMRAPEIHPLFGDPRADRAMRRAEDPFWLAEQALCRFPVARPMIYLDCGLSDPLLEGNRRLADHLNFVGYPNRYDELPGHHTWPYWDRAFKTRLPEIAAALGAATLDAGTTERS